MELIAPGSEITVIEEGEEPEEFWDLLGGKGEYRENFESDLRAVGEARLFHATINSKGRVAVEEIDEFTQRDLVEDDVMILDNGTIVYVWVGSGATEEEHKETAKAAEVS